MGGPLDNSFTKVLFSQEFCTILPKVVAIFSSAVLLSYYLPYSCFSFSIPSNPRKIGRESMTSSASYRKEYSVLVSWSWCHWKRRNRRTKPIKLKSCSSVYIHQFVLNFWFWWSFKFWRSHFQSGFLILDLPQAWMFQVSLKGVMGCRCRRWCVWRSLVLDFWIEKGKPEHDPKKPEPDRYLNNPVVSKWGRIWVLKMISKKIGYQTRTTQNPKKSVFYI